jgi:hypothetical protein
MAYINAAETSAIRTELKNRFPSFKFSVTTRHHSSIHVDILEADVDFLKGLDVPNKSVNYFHVKPEDFNGNGQILLDIINIMNGNFKGAIKQNFDKSEPMIDYFHVVYYINLEIGNWEKPFIYKESRKVVKPASVEPVSGQINLITYGAGLAVIGETKAIKEDLKKLGGRFNPRLTCGCGWVFQKSKLEELKSYLQGLNKPKVEEPQEVEEVSTPPEGYEERKSLNGFPHWFPVEELEQAVEVVEELNAIATPPNTMNLESFKIIWHEGRQNPSYEGAIFTNWEDVQKAFTNIWAANEKDNFSGGYTKVKIQIKLKGEDIQNPTRLDVTNKIFNGDFNPSQEHIISHLLDDKDYSNSSVQVEKFNDLGAIKQAANTGKIISLFNLSNLVNNKQTSIN